MRKKLSKTRPVTRTLPGGLEGGLDIDIKLLKLFGLWVGIEKWTSPVSKWSVSEITGYLKTDHLNTRLNQPDS
jgi:hypothetical protein